LSIHLKSVDGTVLLTTEPFGLMVTGTRKLYHLPLSEGPLSLIPEIKFENVLSPEIRLPLVMMSASAHVINGILAVWLVEILIIIKMNK
jgi:hypothetical protein